MFPDGKAIRCLQSLSFLLLVIWNQRVFGNNLKVLRGQRDRFTNPDCEGSQCKLATCSQYFAKCGGEEICDYCTCDEELATYVATERRCVRDEEVFRRSVPKYTTFGISDTQEQNFLAADNSHLVFHEKYTGKANEQWMYTRTGELMNMEKLQCIDATDYKVTVRPCMANESVSQKWLCDRKISGLYQLVQHKREYLGFQVDSFFISEMHLALYEWIPYNGKPLNRSICDIQDIYQGCYRFHSGDFVTYFPQPWQSDCKNKKTSNCFDEMRISAPILVGNSHCTLLWDDSMFSVNDQTWTTLAGYPNHFTVLNIGGEAREIKLKMHHGAKVLWAGALLKLEIQCEGTARGEQHCVLLKFGGWYTGKEPMEAAMSMTKNSYKASTIALAVVLCVVLLLFAFGAFVVHRRRTNFNLCWFSKTDTFSTQARPFCEAEEEPL